MQSELIVNMTGHIARLEKVRTGHTLIEVIQEIGNDHVQAVIERFHDELVRDALFIEHMFFGQVTMMLVRLALVATVFFRLFRLLLVNTAFRAQEPTLVIVLLR